MMYQSNVTPTKTNDFETADLYLIAYLRSFDILPTSRKNNTKQAVFLFKRTQAFEKKVNAYLTDEWIKKYIKAIRDVKYQIYNPSEILF